MLSGLVDAGQFNDVGINFPAVWIDEEFVDLLPKGVLVAQCTPVLRERPALHFKTLEGEAATHYSQTIANVLAAPKVYSKLYRQRKQPLTGVPAGWSA